MKSAVLFSELMTAAPCYCWRWRSDDGKTKSTRSFVYYLQCLADARANGYDVRPPMGASSAGCDALGHLAFAGAMQGEATLNNGARRERGLTAFPLAQQLAFEPEPLCSSAQTKARTSAICHL
jgi:hypothetical protein